MSCMILRVPLEYHRDPAREVIAGFVEPVVAFVFLDICKALTFEKSDGFQYVWCWLGSEDSTCWYGWMCGFANSRT